MGHSGDRRHDRLDSITSRTIVPVEGPGAAISGELDDDPAGVGVSAGVWCETGSARAVIGAAIRDAVDQLELELPRVRSAADHADDPEPVHQARVATRRLRSDLRTFSPLLDAEWRTHMRAELRWLADALGAVRDADVLRLRLESVVEEARMPSGAADAVFASLSEQEVVARRQLLEVLDDDRTATLLGELRRRAVDPPTTPSALGRADRRLVPLVRAPWRKLTRAVERLGDEPPVDRLHRVRLLAKRARYAAEAVTPVCGRDARRFAAAVKDVQDVLGEMNDASIAADWLRRTAVELDPMSAFVAGDLAHRLSIAAETHRHGWERGFERARRRSSWLT